MIPKSLHTVTVIVAIARELAALGSRPQHGDHVADAVAVLGYVDAPDAYGLADKARKALAKAVQS